MTKKKKFKLVDAILATVCITLVAESVAPTAAIGNSQYFWWILLIAAFCVPYGLITAELGSTFDSEGGMYDWVKRAFGKKWAARVAWNYWINFPLWIASLAVAVTDVVAGIFSIELSIFWLLVLQLGYTWLVSFLGTQRIGESKWIVNLGTFFKIAFMVGLGLLGIYVYIKTGQSANPIESVTDLLPSLDLAGLSFISIIIFNFLGFEVVATFADDMENPKKEIPKALIIGGALMALFYVLPATGINIAMSLEDAEASGITESFMILLTKLGMNADAVRIFVIIVGMMFIYTMVANIVSWSFGVNSVAKYSADDGGLPKIFSKTNKRGEKISLRIFPLGGYCAFEGENGEGADKNPNAFTNQKPWKRIIVLFSGAFFNFLSAILFSFILLTGIFPHTLCIFNIGLTFE